jgi:uncharacterized membrane protein SpoIIM required for sporulation
VILDLDQFIRRERPFWEELERMLRRQIDSARALEISEVRRFYYLYERAASDLVKVQTFAAEPELRRYLENLVGQTYARLHRRRDEAMRFRPLRWLLVTFPQTFRRQVAAFWISLSLSALGALFGGFVLSQDPENKALLLPPGFGHLSDSPSERVRIEESRAGKMRGEISAAAPVFSAALMRHNIKVSLLTFSTGILWGVFTCVLLFYNGVIVGFVAFDFIADGQALFLCGWLLPHGVPELTAVFIAGQAGLVLARAMIGWGTNLRLARRLQLVRDDLATLAGGLAVMLVWAGLVEGFLSQHHGPHLYAWKIGFGAVELLLLVSFLAFAGRRFQTRTAG